MRYVTGNLHLSNGFAMVDFSMFLQSCDASGLASASNSAVTYWNLGNRDGAGDATFNTTVAGSPTLEKGKLIADIRDAGSRASSCTIAAAYLASRSAHGQGWRHGTQPFGTATNPLRACKRT